MPNPRPAPPLTPGWQAYIAALEPVIGLTIRDEWKPGDPRILDTALRQLATTVFKDQSIKLKVPDAIHGVRVTTLHALIDTANQGVPVQ